eukprot:g573.t1
MFVCARMLKGTVYQTSIDGGGKKDGSLFDFLKKEGYRVSWKRKGGGAPDRKRLYFSGPSNGSGTICSNETLGTVLGWIMVNRDSNDDVCVQLLVPNSAPRAVRFFRFDRIKTKKTHFPEVAGDPWRVIEVAHVHCHFNATNEPKALDILKDVVRAVQSAGQSVAHVNVWHQKNGPHDSDSWELWVDSALGLGAAVHHLMTTSRTSDGDGLYFMFHIDTDQEYTDHAIRFGFVGERDDLDIDFFHPPKSSYAGPRDHVRRSNATHIFSMGKMWNRTRELNRPDAPRGFKSSYGAMKRGNEETGTMENVSGTGKNQAFDSDVASDRSMLAHAKRILTQEAPHHKKIRKDDDDDDDDTKFHAAIFVNLKKLRSNLRALKDAFPKTALHAIALKASPIRGVVEEIVGAGLGLETASLPEFMIALEKLPPCRVVYDSPCKTRAELQFALKHDGVIVNLDSLSEVEKVADIVKKEEWGKSGRPPAFVGLRVNPCVGSGSIAATSTASVGSKFGVCLREHGEKAIVDVFERHNSWLTALHVHVGSGGCRLELLTRGVQTICSLAASIRKRGCKITHIDIGGGIPLDLSNPTKAPSFVEYASVLRKTCPDLFDETLGHRIVTEFGRRVHSTTAHAVSRVASTKKSGGKNIAILHFGADLCLRTAYMPGVWDHRLSVLDGETFKPKTIMMAPVSNWDVAGPLCFSGDFIARDRKLPSMREGDLVVIHDVGAYTLSMWSRYNSRRSPAVFGYDGLGTCQLLRKRETVRDIKRFWSYGDS